MRRRKRDSGAVPDVGDVIFARGEGGVVFEMTVTARTLEDLASGRLTVDTPADHPDVVEDPGPAVEDLQELVEEDVAPAEPDDDNDDHPDAAPPAAAPRGRAHKGG